MIIEHESIEYANPALPVKCLLHEPTAAASAVEPHWHTSLEITYLLSGSRGSFTAGGEEASFAPGAIYIVNSAEIHSSFAEADPELRGVTLFFSRSCLGGLLEDYEHMRFEHFPAPCAASARELSETSGKIYALMSSPRDRLFALRLACLAEKVLLILASEHASWTGGEEGGHGSIRRDEIVRSVIDYVHRHYEEELTVGSIAAAHYLSAGYLGRIFRSELGTSLMKYVAMVRTTAAQKMLLESALPEYEIARRAGFPNVKSFRQSFASIFGETPQRYRTTARGSAGSGQAGRKITSSC